MVGTDCVRYLDDPPSRAVLLHSDHGGLPLKEAERSPQHFDLSAEDPEVGVN